jgi:hypothetical protein
MLFLIGFNVSFGIGSIFIENAIIYIYNNNKAIFITSNQSIKIKSYIPNYYSYDNPILHNIIIKNINLDSFRKSWSDDYVGFDKLDKLIKYDSVNGAGIIIEEKGIDYEKFITKYNEDFISKNLKNVYVPRESSNSRGIVVDLYVHELDNIKRRYDYVLMFVNSNTQIFYGKTIPEKQDSIKQFLNVIEKAYEKNIKLIIVIDSIENFKFNLKYMLEGYNYNETAPRLRDRIKIFFHNLV